MTAIALSLIHFKKQWTDFGRWWNALRCLLCKWRSDVAWEFHNIFALLSDSAEEIGGLFPCHTFILSINWRDWYPFALVFKNFFYAELLKDENDFLLLPSLQPSSALRKACTFRLKIKYFFLVYRMFSLKPHCCKGFKEK